MIFLWHKIIIPTEEGIWIRGNTDRKVRKGQTMNDTRVTGRLTEMKYKLADMQTLIRMSQKISEEIQAEIEEIESAMKWGKNRTEIEG